MEKIVKHFTFNRSVPPNSSRVYFTAERIDNPFRVRVVYPNFALNTQRLLAVWPLATPTDIARQDLPDVFIEPAYQLITGDGYVVGDGQEGERSIRVDQKFEAGLFLAIRAVNSDIANPHTLDFSIEIEEIPHVRSN
jgi:hypothetical protein